MPHICIRVWGQHWFRQWLVAYSAPSHYLNQCWVIANWTLRNKLQWNFYQNTKLFIYENASENIVCQMAAISSTGRWVKQSPAHITPSKPYNISYSIILYVYPMESVPTIYGNTQVINTCSCNSHRTPYYHINRCIDILLYKEHGHISAMGYSL